MKTIEIREALSDRGFFQMKHPCEYTDFLATANVLGTVFATADVKIHAKSHSMVSTPSSVPFHNDDPRARYIGWFCVEQDEHSGESQYIDSRRALKRLNESDLHLLEETFVKCPGTDGVVSKHPVLFKREGERQGFYFAPWLVEESDKSTTALLNLTTALRQTARVKIRLRPGEMIFIDNHRLLHGRDALDTSSNRYLKRAWIL